jgi:acetyltransferase-like isoleucine patch superfamily enzyme
MSIINKKNMNFKFWILKLRGEYQLLKTKTISRKIFLGPNVQFFGLKNIEIKDNCTIGESSLFIVNNRSNDDLQLTINENVYIGRKSFITIGKSVNISEYCILGDNCSLIGAGKLFDSPLIPYALSGINYEKSISIGVNCWFGNDVSVIGNVKIGHGSIVGANALVTKDIPPFSMVVGNPARIIKTFNFETNSWEKGVRTDNFSEYLDEQEYLKYLKSNSGATPLAHYSGSSRLGHL